MSSVCSFGLVLHSAGVKSAPEAQPSEPFTLIRTFHRLVRGNVVMLESPSTKPTLAELSAEAMTLETAIASLDEALGRPGLIGPARAKTERELAALQCQLAQLRTEQRHAAIRSAMS